jgi:hypothetical protein
MPRLKQLQMLIKSKCQLFLAVLWIRAILVRIWIREPCLLPLDPDQDSAIFVLDLQDANKKLFFSKFFYLVFEGTFTSFSKTKSHKEVTKQ